MSGHSTHAALARPALRVEDATLLRGRGRFVDDIALPGLLHASFVRSPVAHARLNGIDASAARALPGVRAVLTYRDLRAAHRPRPHPAGAAGRPRSGFTSIRPGWRRTRLCYVGEPVAVVVAESRALAEDAASLVVLDYEALPAVTDPVAGLSSPARPRRGSTAPTISWRSGR